MSSNMQKTVESTLPDDFSQWLHIEVKKQEGQDGTSMGPHRPPARALNDSLPSMPFGTSPLRLKGLELP